MVVLYGIAVLLGSLALVGWVVWDALAAAPASTQPGPTDRFGTQGRRIVTAALGFGLGGMSAAFAGWNAGVAVVAAIAGALLLAVSAQLLADNHT